MSATRTYSIHQGLALALISAAAFGTAGSFGKSLLDAGWSPVAAVAARVAIGALVLAIPALVMMSGKWHTLRRGWPAVVLFGVLGVGVAQVAFYQAVQHIPVAIALMLEYLGILLVVLYLWLRHGQRPRVLTLVGGVLAVIGLALVLDIFGAGSISVTGVLWGLFAATGLASYFIVSADDSHDVPPLVIATGGLALGTIALCVAGAVGLANWQMSGADVVLAGTTHPVWVSLLGMGVAAAAIAYGLGVIATRAIGSKMASFFGLTEVLFAVLFAWLLLGELPGVIQLLGAAVILTGVVAVKLDEQAPVSPEVCSGKAFETDSLAADPMVRAITPGADAEYQGQQGELSPQ
ncbi:MAG: EamA family transporter [Ornithinimicrobium sp.]